VETPDHESMDSEMVKLLSRVCILCEEKRHAIMDCPFMPFHSKTGIANMWNYRMWEEH
jgi:hypothetical protein